MTDKQKKVVLIVDDVEVNRSVLADILEDEYRILEAKDGLEAIELLKKNDDKIALMLLDIIMPGMTGFDVMALMHRNHWSEMIPVVIISAETSSEYIRKGYEYGAIDYISRPFDPDIVLQRVRNTIMLYSKQKELEDLLQDQVAEKEKNNTLMIDILSTIVEFRNGESGLHVVRIRIITEILLDSLRKKWPEYGIDESAIALISNAAALHDIGKIAIPEEILNKPGKLDKEEFEVIKTHSSIGEEMLAGLHFGQEEKLVKYARQICRWHHERWDGGGYPDGLKGDNIPIAAQIVSVADVYDALVSKRIYKEAYSHKKAMEMILNGECGQFSPKILDCLKEEADYLVDAIKIRSEKPDRIFDINKLSKELIKQKRGKVSDRTLFLLEQERTKYQFLASLSNEVLFEYDMNTDTIVFSESCEEEFGIPTIITDFTDNYKKYEIISESTMKELMEMSKNSTPSAPIFKKKDLLTGADRKEQWHEIIVRSMWMDDGKEAKLYGLIGRVANIHSQTIETKKLEKLAQRDSLTNLYNHMVAREIVARSMEEKRAGLLLLFDLDDFKNVNDSFGHMFGDQVLKHVARQVENNIRKMDIAARVGGDEFMVYIMDIYTEGTARTYCDMLCTALRENYSGSDYSVSMGAAFYPKNGQSYEEVYLHADQALYASKHAGKNRCTYYEEGLEGFSSVLTPMDS